MRGRLAADSEGLPDTAHPFPSEVLQHEIRAVEKELRRLYEQRDAQLLRTRLIPAESVAEKADSARGRLVPCFVEGRTHVLRIEDSPPPSPQSFIPTPESVAFPLTGERRRFVHSSLPLAAARPLTVADPPSEFATRLRRLHQAACTGVTPAELAARISLLCSPISVVNAHDDASCTDLFHEVGSSFAAGSGTTTTTVRDSRDSGAGCPRHVRFSSKSPRVSVFSVERPCDGAASPTNRDGRDGDESTFVRSAALSTVGEADVRVGRFASPVEGVPRNGGAHNASVVLSPPPVDSDASLPVASRISTRPSPRSSVASYLAVLHELRSSLLDTSPRHASRRSIGAPRAAAGDDKVDAATPTKQLAVSAGTEGSKTSVFHFGSPGNAATKRACNLPCCPPQSREALPPQGSSTIVCVEDALDSVVRSSPVFLRRPERQRLSPPTVAQSLPLVPKPLTRGEVAHFEGAGGRRRGGKAQCSLSALQTRARQLVSPPTATTRVKKTVHFPSSLGHPEHDPPQKCAGRRRGKVKRVECAPPTVTTTAKTPADMRVEVPGFGAGILLASGPTLYFE